MLEIGDKVRVIDGEEYELHAPWSRAGTFDSGRGEPTRHTRFKAGSLVAGRVGTIEAVREHPYNEGIRETSAGERVPVGSFGSQYLVRFKEGKAPFEGWFVEEDLVPV